MTTSDWILLATLLVVIAYTTATYLLWLQQRDQFRLSQRPWIHAGDVLFNDDIKPPELGIYLYNLGKLPARCKIIVKKMTVRPTGDDLIQANFITAEESRELTIFPFTQGADSVFMFLLRLEQDQRTLLFDGCKLEFDLSVKYETLNNSPNAYPFSYSAKLKVDRFDEKLKKQVTLIGEVSAT